LNFTSFLTAFLASSFLYSLHFLQVLLLGQCVEASLLFDGCPPLAAALAVGLEGARSFWWRPGGGLFAPGLPSPIGFAGLLGVTA
jgi:hypothetical protein